jgi:hypothetical protein
MTDLEYYLNFPTPTKGIRELYKPEVTVTNEGWTKVHVDVMRNDGLNEDGTEKWTKVAEYDRNYSMLKTFEPFQQLQDGRWRHYALISTRYTRFEVLDLQSGDIVAVQPYPKADKRYEEMTEGKYKEGDELSGMGFCPMEFYVPDWWDEYDETSLPIVDPETGAKSHRFKTDKHAVYLAEDFIQYTGQRAFYAGCIWGDDSSSKLRHIDLSRISEGIVDGDERFGYVQLPENLSLKESIDLSMADDGYIQIITPILFRLETGKALHKELFLEYINWE